MSSKRFKPLREIKKEVRRMDLVEIAFPVMFVEYQPGNPALYDGTERVVGYFVDSNDSAATLSMFQKMGDSTAHNPNDSPVLETSVHKSTIKNKAGRVEIPFSITVHDRTEEPQYRILQRFVPDRNDAIDELLVGYGAIPKPNGWDEQ